MLNDVVIGLNDLIYKIGCFKLIKIFKHATASIEKIFRIKHFSNQKKDNISHRIDLLT